MAWDRGPGGDGGGDVSDFSVGTDFALSDILIDRGIRCKKVVKTKKSSNRSR